jgi:hypothetical protein
MPDAVSGRQLVANPGAVGVRSINFFDMTGPDNSAFGWPLQVGVGRNNTEGNPSAPCIVLAQPGAWRFRWAVKPGARTVAVYCKQPANLSPYPSLAVKADASLGVPSDVEVTSTGGAGWVAVGPASLTITAAGALWVELRNNLRAGYDPTNGSTMPWAPCYFDHLVFT